MIRLKNTFALLLLILAVSGCGALRQDLTLVNVEQPKLPIQKLDPTLVSRVLIIDNSDLFRALQAYDDALQQCNLDKSAILQLITIIEGGKNEPD